MTPGRYDLVLYRGDSYSWTFQLWSDPEKTVAISLTGATVAAEFRDKSEGTVVVTFGTTVTLPNTIDVEMTAEQWTGAPTGGVWDLEVTFPDASVRTMVAGKVSVTADVTNSSPTTFAARLHTA